MRGNGTDFNPFGESGARDGERLSSKQVAPLQGGGFVKSPERISCSPGLSRSCGARAFVCLKNVGHILGMTSEWTAKEPQSEFERWGRCRCLEFKCSKICLSAVGCVSITVFFFWLRILFKKKKKILLTFAVVQWCGAHKP